MLRVLLVCSIIVTGVLAYGEPPLKPVHPDEPASHTFEERFSTGRSLESLAAIQSALDSFKELTKAAADKIPEKKLAEIGNTGWEMQNLGFVNHAGTVRGTILKQDCLIKKLTYELAQRKLQSGEMDPKTLLEAQGEYEKAEKRFQEFWNAFGIAD